MQLTKEQTDIIQSTGNIKINAVAGSGKTTTLIEYARTRPASSKILYLAFNKSVKTEAAGKFLAKGLSHVKVETAHSLAYRHIVFTNSYKVRPQGYKTNELTELLKLRGNGEKHTEYVLANHINKLIACFCNSDKASIQDLHYPDTIKDPKAKAFVLSFYDYILAQARKFLGKMEKGEIDITHDFYLKKFQLSNPKLHYDYILFDEGQDASPAMLDVFLKQDAVKVIVGDTHQQIYGWRYAVNALEKAPFKAHQLSTSFRFSQEIANLAMEVLKYKQHLNTYHPTHITGKGIHKEIKTKAVLARTNLGLLLKAIEYITEKKNLQHIYFVGNFNSYTYAEDGTSLYDVLNLYNKKPHLAKDKLIKAMSGLDELEDYIKKTEDVQLATMVEIVKAYGNKIPEILRAIKEKHVENEHKEKAEMIFSTVHRCKGLEYDAVQLVNDFVSEGKIKKLADELDAEALHPEKLSEEINLLYVAITRAKNSLYIPENLIPDAFPTASAIHVIQTVSEETKEQKSRQARAGDSMYRGSSGAKSYSVKERSATHKAAYRPWTPALDKELTTMFCQGLPIGQMANHFGRTRGAIVSRIRKLELDALYG